MISATVVGASGYIGGEVIRLLINHPKIDKILPVSREHYGKPVSSVHKNLYKIFDENFVDLNLDNINTDVVFLATPPGESFNIAPKLLKKDIKVISLSADYRFQEENKEFAKNAVYGLPEIFREEIKKANLIANPGCYPTSAILAIFPLAKFKEKLEVDKIVVDSISGSSGAGAKPSLFLHHPEVHDNLKPYNVTNHKHRPEMEYILRPFFDGIKLSFTPTLGSWVRGIRTDVHIFTKDMNNDDAIHLHDFYEKFYEKEPFVRITNTPYIANVVYTNFCDISVNYDEHTNRILLISVIDNILKGGSGQAVQNMNIMFGFDEKSGLIFR
ncbi:MAG: N-acetyl-gamma-glutamyl-phosphate reductase [Candidatus Altiarchaeales archaeon HGW-Altiarchaeales-1]|nr:MAG: N-acetyl-gamma-glutamyl-phosphate reductase [Candidatus Altiarchaeales archaeon HGW-Altiarchaeales-1]